MPEEKPPRPPVHLGEIAQIAITVRDLDRSIAFYRDTLGLTFLFHAGAMAFFQCGTVRLMLGTTESTEPFSPSGTFLYFHVAGIHAAHAALAAHGVAFTAAPHLVAKMPDHELWLAFLKDPDGNNIGLMAQVPHAAAEPGR